MQKEAQIVESWDLVVLEGLEGREITVGRVVSAVRRWLFVLFLLAQRMITDCFTTV